MFRWGYIGCGNIAYTTAKELIKTPGQQITAVWNRTKTKAEAFSTKFGSTVYDHVEDLLKAPDVDGVYIAVTADLHALFMKKCILAHKPVLCEKPFTVNAKEAEEIITLAKKEKVYVAEAMWTWQNAVAQKVREWIRGKTIGEVTDVEAAYAWPMLSFNKNPRLTDPKMIGGALMDIGIYAVRYIYELFGMPEEISCEGDILHGVDAGEEIIMRYPEFSARLSVSMRKKKGEYLTIQGTRGKIQVPMFHCTKKAELTGQQAETFHQEALLYGTQFLHVAEDIQNGKTESENVPLQHTLDVMKLLDSCRSQMGIVYPQEYCQEQLNTKIRAISHLGFNCKNLKKTMYFYTHILGAKEKFYLTYGDIADDKEKEAIEKGEPVPGFVKQLRKFQDRKWSVYLQWTDHSFIELFDQMGAFLKRVPGSIDLNYTHFSLEVENIRDFRKMIISRGGSNFLDTPITLGMECTWQMWMHDPEGNKFEIMEYTPQSYQVIGRHDRP